MEILLSNNFVVPPFKFIRWRVFDALRAMARERKAATLYQESLQSFFQDSPEQPKLLEQLMELASLSQLEREILFLRIYQDLSDEEISQHLKRPLQAIKSTAWVMMEKLKTAKRKIEVQNELDGKKGD